jgi:2-polyprenyl-6-methoxyphenol hydroxylase-like FAD-dependent oxidoreductase
MNEISSSDSRRAESPAHGRARHLGADAIVIGASIAGLAAARVLADRFDCVTVIDRDTLAHGPCDRKGVPQGRHGHGLLASGLHALERLFPDLGVDLLAAGAVHGDVIGDVRWFHHGGYKAKFASGLKGFLMSRALLESAIRARVRRLPNVRLVEACHVEGIIADDTATRIIGLRTRSKSAQRARMGELIVDASGRGSRSPAWLAALGYVPPHASTIAVDVRYATRLFRREAGDLDGDRAVVIAATPPNETRQGFMLAIERDRWMVSLGGCLGERAPSDPDGYLEFARSLPRPDIFDVIRRALPLSHVVEFAFPVSRRYRYEALSRFPERYLVLGDALCNVNPIYGQGMSVAALEALELQRCLTEPTGCHRLWRRLFRRTASVVDRAWSLAAGNDLAYPALAGPRQFGSGLVDRYLASMHRTASTDRVVCRKFFDVVNLLAPSWALVRPEIVARVVRYVVAGAADRLLTVDKERR